MASETVDISEHQDGTKRKVVRHVFYGKDHQEAKHNERSHSKSDKFLKAALCGRKFKGITLSVSRGRSRKMARKKSMRKSSKRY